MIRFVINSPTRVVTYPRSRVFEQVDRTMFTPGQGGGQAVSEDPTGPSDPTNPDPVSDNYIRTSSPNGAKYVDDMNYPAQSANQCLYYPTLDYAICGYEDSDPAVTNVGPYATRAEAREALLHDYGYGEPIFFNAYFHTGTFAKALPGEVRYRWHAEIISCRDADGYCIRTDGPEPDPVYFFLFYGGRPAVQDWHAEY